MIKSRRRIAIFDVCRRSYGKASIEAAEVTVQQWLVAFTRSMIHKKRTVYKKFLQADLLSNR